MLIKFVTVDPNVNNVRLERSLFVLYKDEAEDVQMSMKPIELRFILDAAHMAQLSYQMIEVCLESSSMRVYQIEYGE